MSVREGPTLREITMQVLAELTAPASLDEVIQRVLARFPSQSKHPPKRVSDFLHSPDLVGVEVVYLNPKTIVPLRLAMPGVRFRVLLEPDGVQQGILPIHPGFIPCLLQGHFGLVPADQIELLDVNDHPLATRLVTVKMTRETLDGEEVTKEQVAFDLKDWLSAHHARAGDSVLVTILQWRPARLRLELEPRAQYRKADIAAPDRALADLVQTLLDESYDEQIYTHSAILTAYARMPTARVYPGNHWLAVLVNDPRFFVTDFNIRPGEGMSTLDFLRGGWAEPERVKERSFTRGEGNKVYRFRAQARYTSKTRALEILGKHTLADFDDVMRDAFDLDAMDHLSEFTLITPRGKGKKPRKTQYGEINPFEPTPAMELRIAGLGLEVGAELEYVYDFGDWLEHKLVLENIGDPTKGVQDPHFKKVETQRRGQAAKSVV